MTEASSEQRPDPWRSLKAVLPVSDLTDLRSSISPSLRDTHEGEWIASPRDRFVDIAGALHRRERSQVALVGLPGVGKTAACRELARRAGRGDYPSLVGSRFVAIDCRFVGPEDSRACMEMLFAALAREKRVVLCLEGLGSLLRRVAGGSNHHLLCNLLARDHVRLIAPLSPWEHSEWISGNADLRRLFSRIEVEEPDDATASQIVDGHLRKLHERHSLIPEEDLATRVVQLASVFLLHEQHPGKAISLLREAFEQKDFARLQAPQVLPEVKLSDVLNVISDRTGIPVETLSGTGCGADFEEFFESRVVSQPSAVRQAATEMRLIKAGLTEPGKPASVLLFAGPTGVGKTELAKSLAEIYSNTGRPQVYPMGNYTEPHSVSGIIGVPPGYVGHEHGGRLINDLNADPYSVFLLDEAEKCHPNIWKPFLQLFDEGWIADQRGVKAYADRAIFILTTNAGDRQIAQLSASGSSDEAMTEAVRQALSRVRHERSSQPVFPPQFLARIRRIVIFRPLDEAAMIGIARETSRRLTAQWRLKRALSLEIDPLLTEALGRAGHARNVRSRQQEGGRIIRKLFDDIVQDPLHLWLVSMRDGLLSDQRIRVSLSHPHEAGLEDGDIPKERIEISLT